MYGSSASVITLLAVITNPASGSTLLGSDANGTVPVHSQASSQPGTGSRRAASDERTGSSPRHWYAMSPRVSAHTRLLTGSTQPSCASASSVTVRAVSMGSRHSNPRLGRCVPVHLSARASPESGFPCTTGPCLVAQTGTVTGDPPRTSIRSCLTSASAQPDGVRYRVPAKRSRYRSWVSASPCVIAHATEPFDPKCGNPGSPGKVAPVTSKSGQVTRHCQYTFGVSSARCESLQSTAPPCAVRRPLTAHALEPGSTSARNPRCPSRSPSASSSSPATGCVSRPPGGTATGDPVGGRLSRRSKTPAPARASSTALASLCCHCPICTCRTRNPATECHDCQASTGYRAGSGRAPSAMAWLTPLA